MEDIKKLKKKEYMKRWRKENRERIREYDKEYRKLHRSDNKEYKEYQRRYNKEYRRKNKEIILQKKKAYRKANKGIINANTAKRRAYKLDATPSWVDLEKIKIVYEKAKWLESLTGIKYHVDHIIPLKGDGVCGLHCWHNLQILSEEENLSKGNIYE
jgi:hypothetical protein